MKKSIPYMGSKRKIANEIVSIIKDRHKDINVFYDLFGGGGAVSIYASDVFHDVVYNELKKSLCSLMEQLKVGIPDNWWQPVTREEFFRHLQMDDAQSGMIQTCWSFGNRCLTYLYGESVEDVKLSSHDLVVNNSNKALSNFNKLTGFNVQLFDASINIDQRRSFIKSLFKSDKGRIEAIERLNRLPSMIPNNIKVINMDYRDVSIGGNSVVYCDPPYADTGDYGFDFNHDEFYKWALSIDVPVYISEYKMPSDFKLVHSINHRSKFSQQNNNKTIEYLFWNGK